MKPNPPTHWDWPAAGLLVAVIFIAAERLNTAGWTPDLGYVTILAVMGAVLGLALGYSGFGRRGLFWLVSGYSLVIIPSQLVRIIQGETEALAQLASLGGRLWVSLALLLNGKPITDHLFFVSQMCVLFWAIGLYSGFRLVRKPGVFAVLLPSSLPMLVIQYYDGFKPERIWGLAVYFFMALMLTGRLNLIQARQRWAAQRVLVGSDPEFDMGRNIAAAAAIIVIAAWALPAPSAVIPSAVQAWRALTQPFDETRRHLNDMLSALQGDSPDNQSGDLYGNVMGLGRSAGSGEGELFKVITPENSMPRLYWRVRTYDFYQNGSWQTSNSMTQPFDPDSGNLVRADSLPAPTAEFIFNWSAGQSSLLATPVQPVWSSRTGSIQVGSETGASTDPLSWGAVSGLQAGDQYRVRSRLPNPTTNELRGAGSDYPDWIQQRYLQVPDAIKPGLRPLAAQIMAGQPDTYDKVEAVTAYLRENMTYAETVPAPPPGSDPVVWFVTAWKSGFCNYYASAEVLLLRSAGIPARMVVGYSTGKSDRPGIYTVRGLNSHAWPEVYFPGIGWVEFEPTVSQPAILRPSGQEPGEPTQAPGPKTGGGNTPRGGHEAVDPADAGAAANANAADQALARWLWVIISALSLALAGFLAVRIDRRWAISRKAPRAVQKVYTRYNLKTPVWLEHWVRWSEVSSVERSFHAINQALAWLRQPQPDHATPAERADLLTRLLPEAATEIRELTTALEKTFYTPHTADPVLAGRLGWRIRYFTVRRLILGRPEGE